MARQKKIAKRIINPDPIYGNVELQKFINNVMQKGKKSVAQRIVYDAFEIIKQKSKREPLEIFQQAIENSGPIIEVKAKRVGGATYQVPREVRADRRLALGIRWMIAAARAKKGKPMASKLAEELMAAANNEGNAVKKKNDVHRMAEANRAFAHFSW